MENYFIQITSTRPMAFSVNSKHIGVVSREYEALELEVEKEDFVLSCYPLESLAGEIAIPFSAQIEIVGGKIFSKNDNLLVTDFGNGHFIFEAKSPKIIKNSVNLVQISKILDENSISIHKNALNISNNKRTLYYPLPYILSTAEIIDVGPLIFISGTTTDNKMYGLFVNKNLQIEFDGVADKIEYTDGKIITLNNVNDIARHGLVSIYTREQSGFKKSSQYSVYANNEPVPPASTEALPLAFIEAISIENFTLARSYLHPSLSASLQDEHIRAYFGDFVEVLPTLNKITSNLALVYSGNPRFVKTYHFEIKDNRIVDIDTI